MNAKQFLNYDEPTKYRKKSKAKGQPRADHKHIYETVLLCHTFTFPDYKTGGTRESKTELPTRVCTICGRIDEVDRDASYYVYNPIEGLPCRAYSKNLSAKAMRLPKWSANFLDKFATKVSVE